MVASAKLWWLLALSWCLACGGPRLGAGAGAWHAVESRHFVVYTDLPVEKAESRAKALEHLLFALQETAWEANSDLPLRLNVVMFRNRVDFDRFGKGAIDGYALSEVLYEPWIVLPAPRYTDGYATVAHELTHFMAFAAMQNQPAWFAEGLASYFESARLAADGSFEVGGIPEARFRALREAGWLSPSTLLAGSDPERGPKFYGSAWLFVHYLMTRSGEAFSAYQQNLARGLNAREAFRAAFPALEGEALDRAVQDYALQGSFASYAFELELPSVRVATRTLSLADEHVLNALLWSTCNHCSTVERAAWRGELESALRLEPTHVQGVALGVAEGFDTDEGALRRAEALTSAHPEHWLSWVTLGLSAVRIGRLAEFASDPASDPGAHAQKLAPHAAVRAARGSLLACGPRRTQPGARPLEGGGAASADQRRAARRAS